MGQLSDALKYLNVDFGTCIDSKSLKNSAYYYQVVNEFNLVSAEVETKMEFTQPQPVGFSLNGAGAIDSFAEGNYKKFQGHTLVWHQQNPAWLETYPTSNLRGKLLERIIQMINNFSYCYTWYIGNELWDKYGYVRYSPWTKIGSDWIVLAYETANGAKTSSQGIGYNGIFPDTSRAEVDQALNLARKGLINYVGFQFHLPLFKDIKNFITYLNWYKNVFNEFKQLGVNVEITELDIAISDPPKLFEEDMQSMMFVEVFRMVNEVENLRSIQTWGASDLDSWIQWAYPGKGNATLFDKQRKPKPAYYKILEMLGV